MSRLATSPSRGNLIGTSTRFGAVGTRAAVAAFLFCSLVVTTISGASRSASATAQTPTTAQQRANTELDADTIQVLEVTGAIDKIEASFIKSSLNRAKDHRAALVVIQLNSSATRISDDELVALSDAIKKSQVPVAVWVGPSGARATNAAVALVEAADISAISPKSHVGNYPRAQHETLRGHGITGDKAVESGAILVSAPVLGDLLVELDGKTLKNQELDTARVVRTKQGPRREVSIPTVFSKPALMDRLLHTVSSPAVTYLLLLIGLLLIAFEYFSSGVGLVGGCGAVCLILAGFGLGVLPGPNWPVVLLVIAVLGLSIDAQAGAPRAWTGIGSISLLVGTWGFIRHSELGILTALIGVIGTLLFMVPGIASMVRARFSTPTIGRESMVGREGETLERLDPEGLVEVSGVPWRAKVNRATPLDKGAKVTVSAITGVILEVEPAKPSH